MHIVSSGCGPLETITIEYLGGVVVSGFYPVHLMSAAQVIGHQGTQQRDKVGIIHHALKCLLELFHLYRFQCDACFSKTVEDISKILAMDIVRMEHDTLLRRGAEQHNGTCYLVYGRELEDVVKFIIGYHADNDIGTK